jgi:exopolysaccharide production protein ExoQ
MNHSGVDGDERGRFMKSKRSVALPRTGVTNFYVIVPSLGIMLLFAAAAYAVVGWPLAFGSFGATGDEARELEQLSQSNTANQIIWLALFGTGVLLVARRVMRGIMPIMTLSLTMIFVYLLLALASSMWALAPDISLRRWLQQVLVVFIFTGVTMFVRDKVRVLNAVFVVFALAIVLNTLLVPVIPAGSLGYAGIYAQKNALGAVAALTLIFSLCYLLSNGSMYRIFLVLITIFSAGLLVISQSKTSLGLALLCPILASVIVILSRLLGMPMLGALLIVFSATSILFFLVVDGLQFSTEDLSMLLFNDTTFTGRSYIWNYVLGFHEQHPWLGWGYQSFWSIGPESPSLKAGSFIAGLNQSHNGYVDILLETGNIGLIVIVIFLIGLCHAIDRSWRERADVSILLLSLTLFCGAHNLLESSLTRGFAVPWVTLLVVAGVANATRTAPTS